MLVALCLLACGGCGGGDDSDPSSGATSPRSPNAGAQPSNRVLPAAWHEDPDGDLVPTAVETQLGTDPQVDGCAREAGCTGAGGESVLERSNTLLILDASGSMAASAGGGVTKLEAAKRALRRFVAGTPDSLALGFMVYGHRGSNTPAGKQESCAGVQLLDPIRTAASKGFARTLDAFRATGYTPLAAALRKAGEAFDGRAREINRIILVTDGIETCGGAPVAEARKLRRANISVTTDVVGFDIAKPDEARRLRAIAEASGGEYSDARTAAALDDYFEKARERAAELTEEHLCLIGEATDISICQRSAKVDASLYMLRAATEASRAGRDAEAREIKRLRSEMKAAADERADELGARREATEQRLQRELDEARQRRDRLGSR